MIIKIQKNYFINLNNCKFFHIHKDNLQRTCITIDDRYLNDKSTFVIGEIKSPGNKYCKLVSEKVSEHLDMGIPFLDAFQICKKPVKSEREETLENIDINNDIEYDDEIEQIV